MSRIDEVLGPEGAIAKAMERWEDRPQQLEMAHAVERSFDERRPLIVEAATGTGKTLAYLVPALLSGKRVIVSTGTKALQEQLFYRDIPFVDEHWHEDVNAVLLKGRRNYLCKLRFESMKMNPAFRSRQDAQLWPKIISWASHTETGDRAEIEGLPDDWPTWSDLSVGAEGCLGTDCPHYDGCHVTKARRDATTARLIVVNHHLFFADLALKDGGFGELLPPYDAVIFDEAHHLESVATSYFGIELSNYRFVELTGDIRRALDEESLNEDAVEDAIVELDKAAKTFLSNLTIGLYDGRYELEAHLAGKGGALVGSSQTELEDALRKLEIATKKTRLSESHPRLHERAAEIAADVRFLMRHADPKYVYFLELRSGGTFLQAMPIDLADLMRRKLLETHDTMVFTSATLSTGGDFAYFRDRLGIEEEYSVEELILPPVFDYTEQCLIYVPNRLPAPNHPEFMDGFCTITDYLLRISGGRAFVLFTSYANMDEAWDRMSDDLAESFTCLRQGDGPKNELLGRFREADRPILFATSSFWEGVDVVGDKLSLVIIDKLPFANPSDPLVRARLDLVDESGGNSFMEFSLPQAALTLKQGFGRLIRSREDRGVVAILDSRVAKKRYGRYFLDSLPPAPVVWRAAGVRDWWADHIG